METSSITSCADVGYDQTADLEMDLLVGQQDSPVPVFDTTRLHAHRAVELALDA